MRRCCLSQLSIASAPVSSWFVNREVRPLEFLFSSKASNSPSSAVIARSAHILCTYQVSVGEDEQVRRVQGRDHVDAESARAVMRAQMPTEAKVRRADIVLDNSGTIDDLRALMARHDLPT